VVSPASGVVAYAGRVAGRSVVSVVHDDGHRSSMLPVTAHVPVGTRVAAGDPLGTAAGGEPDRDTRAHCHAPCVHWGVRLDGDYVDPLHLLRPPIRLLPRHGARHGAPW
jgi:murein DD-endopeptidase MepM/ murein hydrolase activator NlpD